MRRQLVVDADLNLGYIFSFWMIKCYIDIAHFKMLNAWEIIAFYIIFQCPLCEQKKKKSKENKNKVKV